MGRHRRAWPRLCRRSLQRPAAPGAGAALGPCPAFRTGRGIRRRGRARTARQHRRPFGGRPACLLPLHRRSLRARCGAAARGGRGLAGRAEPGTRGPSGRGRRATASGAAAPAQHGAGRHCRAGRAAAGTAGPPQGRTDAAHPGCRPASPAGIMVQPRLPGAAPDRLADARRGTGKTHPLRGRARDSGMGRPAPAAGSGPPLLRLLPSRAARRAADLRRGRAGARHGRGDRAPARARPAPGACRGGRQRDLLLDLELPGRPARHLVRQLPDQAGGRGAEGRTAPARPLRHAVAGAGLPPLAGTAPCCRRRRIAVPSGRGGVVRRRSRCRIPGHGRRRLGRRSGAGAGAAGTAAAAGGDVSHAAQYRRRRHRSRRALPSR